MGYSFTVSTPFTNLGVITQDNKVVAIESVGETRNIRPKTSFDRSVASKISRYCKSNDASLDFPVELDGTPFQRKVWRALQKIPAGKVLTYGTLAAKLKTSARAVGNACRRNPALLVVPCHRVVAAHGIGGFAGKNIGKWPRIKQKLLAHEGVFYELN